MESISEKFEKQIHRIHKLIERNDAEIIWNDHIEDPDNPTQSRQIDISIKYPDSLTIIECRIHKKPQDVKWIEELIGRRSSLRADAVIAVSASGFTKGAIKKADKFGIILRDILSLTEEEISNWGKKTKVWLAFHKYSDVKLTFEFLDSDRNRVNLDQLVNYVNSSPEVLFSIFQAVASVIDDNNQKGITCRFKSELKTSVVEIGEIKPTKLTLDVKVEFLKRELNIPSVVAYDVPSADYLTRNSYVEAVELGDFEITQSSNDVAVAIDLSTLEIPDNCMFRTVLFDFGRVITLHTMYPIGLPKFKIPLDGIYVEISFK